VFTGAVSDHLFTYTRKTSPFGNHRDVAVHFAVYFNIFDHFAPVGLQSAVEIMQTDARHAAGNGIEQFGGKGFAHRIETLLFPAGNKIVAFFPDLLIKRRDLVRTVLQISVHGNDYLAFGCLKANVERCRLPVIAAEADAADVWV